MNKKKNYKFINKYIQYSLMTNLNIEEKKVVNYINHILIYNKYLDNLQNITKNDKIKHNNIEMYDYNTNKSEINLINFLLNESYTQLNIYNVNNSIDENFNFEKEINYYD